MLRQVETANQYPYEKGGNKHRTEKIKGGVREIKKEISEREDSATERVRNT